MARHKREQQLMTAAWYDLGLQCQRQQAESIRGSGGTTFLAEQRRTIGTPKR
jgi:hypothetical protein